MISRNSNKMIREQQVKIRKPHSEEKILNKRKNKIILIVQNINTQDIKSKFRINYEEDDEGLKTVSNDVFEDRADKNKIVFKKTEN